MAKDPVADLRKRADEVAKERARLEEELLAAQEKLRDVDPTKRTGHAHLGEVNNLKTEIARVAQDNVELARMVALISGGKNYQPPAGP
jgi:hypothetical protein